MLLIIFVNIGRYSWAAEGDTPYYEPNIPERETRSELYVPRTFSSSSSSANSFDSGSSNSLCDNDSSSESPAPTAQTSQPKARYPRSSCLKKRPKTQYIETHVIEEGIGSTSPRQRRSESNLLDSNIFGSLKNILSLSTSVPLAERGVPEGQEDVSMYSSSQSLGSQSKQKAFGNRDSWVSKSVDRCEKIPELPKKNNNVVVEPARSHLKLIPSEEVVQTQNSTLPPNAIICDSTVYEHTGISYSYEYDKFQKSFENQAATHKPKSSTVYQLLLRDLNFFKKKEKELSESNLQSLCNPQSPTTSTPIKETFNSNKGASNQSQSDWSSETTETISDLCDNVPSKHLCSPKHKVKANHYSVQNFKPVDNSDSKSDDQANKVALKATTSKTSLINRFLRNVTMKKLLDAKMQKKPKAELNKCMGLYLKGVKPVENLGRDLDKEIEEEIKNCKKKEDSVEAKVGSNFVIKLKREVFVDPTEKLCNVSILLFVIFNGCQAYF